MKKVNALVLAAGKGTRMVSNRAKVLHKVCGVPMIRLICDAVEEAGVGEILVVVGYDAGRVQAELEGRRCRFVNQTEQLGTGHAVMSAREVLSELGGDLMVVTGDTPRIRAATLRGLADRHAESGAAATLLTVETHEPHGYGRIVRAADGSVAGIVEQKDATEEQRRIREINPGFYCFRVPDLIDALSRIRNVNAQREYYLTDVIGILRADGKRVEGLLHPDYDELKGINSRRELAELSAALGRRKNADLMAGGTTFIDPERTYVELGVSIGKDTILYPGVVIEGSTRIGDGTVIRSGVRITDSVVGAEVEVLESSVITDSEIGDGAKVGPFARLRDHSKVGRNCRVGNFVELKNASLGNGSKAAHLAYLGDARIGEDVNIGAGAITCNYDGVRKNVTVVEDGAFVGTDSQLVAPVVVGRGAYVAAGSCITSDVPPGALAIARSRQVVKEGWAERRRAARQKP